MTINTLTILDTTVYGQASGNYDGSSLDWSSDAVRGVNYYGGQGSIQTITTDLTSFIGVVTIQASLNDNPDSAVWFDVLELGDGSTAYSDHGVNSIIGNFVWVRAHITGFDGGTIGGITISY